MNYSYFYTIKRNNTKPLENKVICLGYLRCHEDFGHEMN